MKFADPKNELAFKKIFGNIEHKNILISFLNAVLDFKEMQRISDVELANPYQIPKIEGLKETVLDIKATNQRGDSFIVEMQKKDLGNFAKRSLYYTSKAYVEQLPKGGNYTILKKVYFIGILNFNIFDNTNFISRHLIINQETKTQDLDDFEFSFIELPKFQKSVEELDSILNKWVYFIKYASDLSVIPKEYASISEFEQAFTIANQSTWDQKELEIYDYISLKEFDEINAINTAQKKGEEIGLQMGLEKGEQIGLQKGEQIGILKGKVMALMGLYEDEVLSLKSLQEKLLPLQAQIDDKAFWVEIEKKM